MRRLFVSLFAVACLVAMAPALFAFAQETVKGGPRHAQPHSRSASDATPAAQTPNPALATVPPSSLPSAAARALASNVPPFPAFPGRGRRIKSASGGTICVSLTAGGTTCSPSGTVPTQIIPVNTSATWSSANLPNTTGAVYDDYWMAPDMTTPVKLTSSKYKGATGGSESVNFTETGVYVFGALNTGTNNWDAVVYIVVGTAFEFDTYADAALTDAESNFTPGSTIYISGTSLTPTDQYVYTVESTSISGACVFTAPTSSPTSTLCNVSAITGFNAPGGTYTAAWNTSTSLAGGTYSVSLYDRTTNRRLSQRQIVITGGSASLSISATNSTGTINNVTAFAFNGSDPYADTTAGYSATLNVSATGLPLATTVYFTVTDPNGTVIAQPSNYSTAGTITNAFLLTLGSTNSPRFFGPDIYTVTANNRTSSNNPPTLLATQSLRLLGYTAAITWGNGTVAEQTSGTPTATANDSIIYTNDGATHFGSNADSISKFVTSSPPSGGSSKDPGAGFTSQGACAGTCSQTVTDSNGHNWTVTIVCTGAGCGSTGNSARSYVITSVPVTAGYGLPPGATLTTPSISVYDYGNGCSSGCTWKTGIQPLHGNGVSFNGGSSNVSNGIQVIANNSTSYGLTASVSLYGTRVGTTIYPNVLEEGSATGTLYQPRFSQALYALGQPLATSLTNAKEILAVTVTNTTNSSSQGAINTMAMTFPSGWNTSTMAVNAALNNNWKSTSCYSPAPVNAFCVTQNGVSLTPSGFSYGVHTDTIYVEVDPPSSSAQPSAMSLLVLDSPNWGSTAATGSATVEAGTPTTVTPLQFDVYSLSAALMTVAASPGSIGQGSSGSPRNQSVGFTFQNTPTSSDANPDSVDALVVEIDPQTSTTVAFPSSWTVAPTGWSFLGTTTASSGATDYWYGICATQMNASAVPNSTSPFGTGIPACTASVESSSSLTAGALATISGTASVQNGTGNVTGRIYAHGANGNGWSSGSSFSIAVTNADAATAGFSTVNGVPVAQGVQPTVAGDPSTVNGSSFGYTISNTGNTTITTATVTIPGPDITGSSDQESTSVAYFKITSSAAQINSGLVYTGGGSGCSSTITQPVIASTGPVVVTPGKIVLSGCSIPAGGSVTLNFNALSPATVNSTYQFSTKFNSSIAASEAWFSDTQLKIALGATLSVTVNPSGTGPGGSVASVSCGLTPSGTFSGSLTSYIDFGAVAVGQTATCQDAILVSIATNAGGTVGWTLYVSADGNPNNNAFVAVDNTRSVGNSVTYTTTSYTAISTSTGTGGNQLASRATGNAAQRTPYDVLTSFRVTPTSTTGATQYLTYTFIAQ